MSEKKPVVPFMDLAALHAPLEAELLEVFRLALQSSGFIGGEQVSNFEREFAAFCHSSHCTGVGSGTDALRLALLALNTGKGDVVVTVPNTFIATTEAISQTGARFEFVDIDPATSLMDMNLLERRLATGPRVAAVIPVHLYGQCADMQALMELSERFGFAVVEDACQAHGAEQHGRRAGSMGHAAAFSFYPGKNLGACGEAGAVTTSDPELARRVACLRDHGQEQKYHHSAEGYNGRLDAIQAGVLRVKLPHLEEWNRQRREAAKRYDQAFSGAPGLRPVAMATGNVSARHLYVLHHSDRDGLMAHLAARGIQSGLHYPLPLHLQECYRHLGLGAGAFPHAEAAARQLVSLPLFPGMTGEHTQRVIDAVLAYGG